MIQVYVHKKTRIHRRTCTQIYLPYKIHSQSNMLMHNVTGYTQNHLPQE